MKIILTDIIVWVFFIQVFRIRGELRKRKMQYVSVERVFNVQGIELILFIYYFFIQSGGK